MKELLDVLDERVTSLLRETDSLRQENAQLRQSMAERTAPLMEENAALQEALAQERAAKETAANRIDSLLQRLGEHMPD